MLTFFFGFVILFGALVTVHEWGHYAAARALGIHATHFSIGFGPVIWSRTDSRGCKWQVCLLPLGGFVKFLGDKNGSSAAPDSELVAAARNMTSEMRRRYFHLRGPASRAFVIFAGPGVNLLFGLALIASLYMTIGRPNVPPVVGQVVAGMPAEAAGVQAGDRILTVNGKAIGSYSDVHDEISLYPKAVVELTVSRSVDGVEKVVPFSIRSTTETVDSLGRKQTVGRIGIRSGEAKLERLGPIKALGDGVSDIYKITTSTFVAVGQIISGTRPLDDIGGPVRMAEASGHALQAGVAFFVFFMAAMSVNLAVVNLLPIPVLDGGQLVVCAIEAVIRRPVNERVLGYAQTAGGCALIGLMVVLSVNDVMNLVFRLLG